MQHEVIMNLVGYPSSFLAEIAEDNQLSDPCEAMIVKRILNISSSYTSLKKFIVNRICIIGLHKFPSTNSDGSHVNSPQPGAYLEAFCNGLNEVLVPYFEDIKKLEVKILNDPYLPLLTIVSKAEEYSKLFEVLNGMIKQISEQNIHGCQILDFLNRVMASNVGDVKDSLRCIIHSCHIVFYKQLSYWLLYGQLIDGYKEFFIQPCSDSDDVDDEDRNTSLVMDSFSSHDMNELLLKSGSMSGSHKYTIHYDLLPSYISPLVAKKILFIGETILMFCCDPKEKGDMIFITSKHVTSIWGGKEAEFYKKLETLQNMKTFNRTEFEKTVDEFKSCVTEHLWKVAVEEAELSLQLKLLKDFFLLGRGELFLEFIRHASFVLQNPPVGTSSRDVNQAFHKAAHKILINDDIIEKFSFVLPGKGYVAPEETKGKNCCWNLLTLTYKVTWPLHLLFDKKVLDNYNKLFCFLLRVKKTQLDLHNVWRSHMECKKRKMEESETAICHLRNQLMFLVDNLQYYLQVDVLESQYVQLQSSINATKDFEQIQKAHTIFQANILSQTFLLVDEVSGSGSSPNPVQNILNKVLLLCERFCTSVCQWGNDLNLEQSDELNEMVTEHGCLVLFLFQLLSDLSVHPCGSHLSQLLLRLDYNRWFSEQHNNSKINNSL